MEDLYTLFRNRLRACAAEVYAPLLASGAVRTSEVEEEIERYHARRRAGLQEVYSFYGEQWDAFYRVKATQDAGFLSELGRLNRAFSARYDSCELNVDYYLQLFRSMSAGSWPWNTLRHLFEERWEKALSDREYNYQLIHIEQLCADYYRIVRQTAEKLANCGRKGDDTAPRLEWLQSKQTPELRKRLRELALILKRNPIVRELNARLGRQTPLGQKRYKALNDKHSLHTIKRSSPSDITGVKEGDNLNALLPLEYAYMADTVLHPFFLKRYTEKTLQVFEVASQVTERGKATPHSGNDTPNPSMQGPFVVCVDSSGSMAGVREDIAKAIVLSVGLLSEQTGRRCRVILFSDQTETVEFGSLYEGLPLLSEFFCRSFHGGTDVQTALTEAVASLWTADYAYADLLILSDFEVETPDEVGQSRLKELKEKGVGMYAVAFGRRPNDFYLNIVDKYWMYK